MQSAQRRLWRYVWWHLRCVLCKSFGCWVQAVLCPCDIHQSRSLWQTENCQNRMELRTWRMMTFRSSIFLRWWAIEKKHTIGRLDCSKHSKGDECISCGCLQQNIISYWLLLVNAVATVAILTRHLIPVRSCNLPCSCPMHLRTTIQMLDMCIKIISSNLSLSILTSVRPLQVNVIRSSFCAYHLRWEDVRQSDCKELAASCLQKTAILDTCWRNKGTWALMAELPHFSYVEFCDQATSSNNFWTRQLSLSAYRSWA